MNAPLIKTSPVPLYYIVEELPILGGWHNVIAVAFDKRTAERICETLTRETDISAFVQVIYK